MKTPEEWAQSSLDTYISNAVELVAEIQKEAIDDERARLRVLMEARGVDQDIIDSLLNP